MLVRNAYFSLGREVVVACFALIPALVWLMYAAEIPARVPMQFNLQGDVTRLGPSWQLPLIGLGLYLVLLILPQFHYAQHPDSFPLQLIYRFRMAVHALFAFITLDLYFGAATGREDVFAYIFAGVLSFMAFVGFHLRTLEPNGAFGIRTPWALENGENWHATHTMASYLWVGLGVAGAALVVYHRAFHDAFLTLLTFLGGMLLLPIGYSYLLHRRQQEQGV
jgi:uncharacterized membrane protein